MCVCVCVCVCVLVACQISRVAYLICVHVGQSDSEHSDAARISAGLCHVAQFTWLLQQILHTPLPYPLSAVTAIRCANMKCHCCYEIIVVV